MNTWPVWFEGPVRVFYFYIHKTDFLVIQLKLGHYFTMYNSNRIDDGISYKTKIVGCVRFGC